MITMTAGRRILAIAAGAALVLVVVWYFALWHTEAKQLRSAHAARVAAEQQASQLDGQVLHLEGLLPKVKADTARLAVLQAALPDTPQLDTALVQLHTAAVMSGVTLLSVEPSAPATTSTSAGSSSTSKSSSGSSSSSSGSTPASPGASSSSSGEPSLTLGLNVQGPPARLLGFVSTLTRMPRTLVIQSVALSGTTATISAQIFYTGS